MKLLIKYVFIIFVPRLLDPELFRNIPGFRNRDYEIPNPMIFKNQFLLAVLVSTETNRVTKCPFT